MIVCGAAELVVKPKAAMRSLETVVVPIGACWLAGRRCGNKGAAADNLAKEGSLAANSLVSEREPAESDWNRGPKQTELAGRIAAVFDIGLFQMDPGVVRGHGNRAGEDIG